MPKNKVIVKSKLSNVHGLSQVLVVLVKNILERIVTIVEIPAQMIFRRPNIPVEAQPATAMTQLEPPTRVHARSLPLAATPGRSRAP